MQAYVDRKELRAAITLTRKAIPRRRPMGETPVHRCLELAPAGDGFVSVRSTDSDGNGARVTLKCDGRLEGPMLIDAAALAKMVPAKGPERVTLESAAQGASATVGAALVTVEYAAADMLEAPQGEWLEPDGRFDVDTLRAALAGCIPAASSDETRYNLCGAFLEVTPEDGARMVSTDGHRMAVHTLDGLGLDYRGRDVIIPMVGLRILEAALRKARAGYVDMARFASMMRFSFGGWEVFARAIEGEYPAYRNVIPAREYGRLELEPGTLEAALDAVSGATPEHNRAVQFTVGDSDVIVHASSLETGADATHRAGCTVSDPLEPGQSFAMNADYLRAAIAGLEGPVSLWWGRDATSPFCFTGRDIGASTLRVVMPLRV